MNDVKHTVNKDVFTNAEVRVFMAPDGGRLEYLDRIAIWRILWRGIGGRIILYGPPCPFLMETPERCDLSLQDRMQRQHFMALFGCRVRNRWMPKPITLRPNDVMPVTVFLELEFDQIVWWGED